MTKRMRRLACLLVLSLLCSLCSCVITGVTEPGTKPARTTEEVGQPDESGRTTDGTGSRYEPGTFAPSTTEPESRDPIEPPTGEPSTGESVTTKEETTTKEPSSTTEPNQCAHTGGSATRYSLALCTLCGEYYGDYANQEATPTRDPIAYASDYGYTALLNYANAENLQRFYRALQAEVYTFHMNPSATSNKGVLSAHAIADYGITMEDAAMVWRYLRLDNPLLYWIENRYSYTNTHFYVNVEEAYDSTTVRAVYNTLVYNTVEEWLRELEGNESIYGITLYLHDKIIDTVDYAYDASGQPELASWAHNIIGAMDKGAVVCEGYSKMFLLFLNYIGVDAVPVIGQSHGQNHEWEMVKLDDGKWYYFDLTWDDRPGFMWGMTYNYFCVAEGEINSSMDGGWTIAESTFSDDHAPAVGGVGIQAFYTLPNASRTPYHSNAHLMLRDTVELNGLSYCLVGYRALQLFGLEKGGDVVLPDMETYRGEPMRVIAIGGVGEHGLLGDYPIACTSSVGTLTLPSSLRYIWGSALGISAKAYELAEENPYFQTESGVLYTKGLETLIQYPTASDATAFALPTSTLYIAYGAFAERTALTSLTLGRQLKGVGLLSKGGGWYPHFTPVNEAFDHIDEAYIGYIASCLAPNGRLTVEEGSTLWQISGNYLISLDGTVLYALLDRALTEALDIPSGVTHIEAYAFYNCDALTKVWLSKELTDISSYAFEGCSSLRYVNYEGSSAYRQAHLSIWAPNTVLTSARWSFNVLLQKAA